MKVTPLILAAGESRRMGRPKALLDFDGTSCLEMVLEICRRSRALPPLVVLGFSADKVRPVLPAGTQVVVNADYARGQISSLKAGLEAVPADSDGFLLFPVDFPLVAPETVNALIDSEGMIAIPTYGESRGHPARFHGSLVKEFLALTDDQPAHVVVRKDPSRVVELAVEDPAVVMKMNTPEEYEFCLAAYRRMTGC